jgi:trigger factor
MKSSVEKVSSLERRLNVEIPATVVSQTMEEMLKGVQKQANIKGFRQGKAPIATIKSIYGERVKQDLIQDLIQKHYFKAVQEHKLDPISYPEFEFDSVSEGQNFSFTAHIEIKPEVQLKKIEGLEVEKEMLDISEQKVNDVLENIRAARAELVSVLENRPAATGDIAVIDFEGFVNGAPLENGTAKDHNLELGSSSFIAGFEDGIMGMTIGQSKTLNLKFPDPYHAADLAGKPVDFKVTLTGLKKKQLPELNDEFVAKMMGAQPQQPQTLAALKETIKKDIEQSETKRIEGDFKNRLLKALVAANPVEVPPSLLKEQKQSLIQDMQKRMTEQGLGEPEFKTYVEKWDKDFESSASEMIQSGFIVDTIAKEKDLKWTEADLEKKFDEYAAQTGIEKSRIREFYSKPEQMNRVTYAITEDKVIAFLVKGAKVKEVSKEKLKETLG